MGAWHPNVFGALMLQLEGRCHRQFQICKNIGIRRFFSSIPWFFYAISFSGVVPIGTTINCSVVLPSGEVDGDRARRSAVAQHLDLWLLAVRSPQRHGAWHTVVWISQSRRSQVPSKLYRMDAGGAHGHQERYNYRAMSNKTRQLLKTAQ